MQTSSADQSNTINKGVVLAITVAALGYFVDIYDLLSFAILRVKSLTSLGVGAKEMTQTGEFLMNCQMGGLLIGGILWGVMGDKKGRLSVLFGSILMYSAANMANAFVQDVNLYALFRFIAGVGLAGELGAGVTLIAEIMPKKTRGYGATIIASFGLLGAVAASLISKVEPAQFGLEIEAWRLTYFIGGLLGTLLLVMRIGVFESGLFEKTKSEKVQHGNLLLLTRDSKTFIKYLRCILIGLPTWFVVGILITQSKEFGESLGFKFVSDPADSVLFTYAGLSVGDLLCGLLSQFLQSRKKAMFVFVVFTAAMIVAYLNLHNISQTTFFIFCFFMGMSVGFWAIFVTIASEQFGTNIRATVTTTVPNFVRGALIPTTMVFSLFRAQYGMVTAAYIVGAICIVISLVAIYFLEETFGKDLDYLESVE